MASLLCRFGTHLRYRASKTGLLWRCKGCPSLWCQRRTARGKPWWEKVR